MLPLIYNPRIWLRCPWLFPVHFSDLWGVLGKQFVLFRFMHIHVVGSNAYLTIVERLGQRDTPRRHVNIGHFVDDNRALASDAKCLEAASMATFPSVGAPVKKMWLSGCFNRFWDVSIAPSTTATSVSSNTSSTIFLMRAEECGVNSDGLMMAVIPAATALMSGRKLKLKGKVLFR